jgi:hypothetical protein
VGLTLVLGAVIALSACSGPPDETAGGCRVHVGAPGLSEQGQVIADTEWSCRQPADQIYGEATLWYCPEPRTESPTEWAQHGCQIRATVGVNTTPLAGGAASGSRLTDAGATAVSGAGVWTVVATWGSYAPAEAPKDRSATGPIHGPWVPLPVPPPTPVSSAASE